MCSKYIPKVYIINIYQRYILCTKTDQDRPHFGIDTKPVSSISPRCVCVCRGGGGYSDIFTLTYAGGGGGVRTHIMFWGMKILWIFFFFGGGGSSQN